jgi:hypothetical protein
MAGKGNKRNVPRRSTAKGRPRRIGDIQNCVLTSSEINAATARKVAFMKDNHLHPIGADGKLDPKHPQITELLRTSKDGGEASTLKTIGQYRPYWLELGRFASKMHCVRTESICDDKMRPQNPLPADPKTIMLWYQWKSVEAGLPVMVPGSVEQARWANGDLMFSNGKWKAAVNIRRARTAIRMLHKSFKMCRGDYSEACADCVQSNMDAGDKPGEPLDFSVGKVWLHCGNHSGGGSLRDKGDPTNQHQCEKTFSNLRKFLEANHTVRGNVQLTPLQIRNIRKGMLNTGGGGGVVWKLKNLQTYVMMLLGIKLFLRADEIITLKLDQFRTECFEVDVEAGRIEKLVVWVQGKSDTEPVTLCIYRDDDNPEFCPIRHLMTYLSYTKIEGGYLFPDWDKELYDHLEKETRELWVTETFVSYESFLDRLQVS